MCVNGHIPRLPFIGRKRGTPAPPKEKGTPSKASSSSSGGAAKSGDEDAESENSRLLLRQRLMTLTVKDMREFAARRRILLSPSKRKVRGFKVEGVEGLPISDPPLIVFVFLGRGGRLHQEATKGCVGRHADPRGVQGAT